MHRGDSEATRRFPAAAGASVGFLALRRPLRRREDGESPDPRSGVVDKGACGRRRRGGVVGVALLLFRGLPSSASSSTRLPGCGGASLRSMFSPASAGGWCWVYKSFGLQIIKVELDIDGFVFGGLGDGVVPAVFQRFSSPPCESED